MDELARLLPTAGAWGEAALAPPTTREVLHLRDGAAAGLQGRLLHAEPYGGGHALRLGPEEWLLLDATVGPIEAPHSLVDVSDRQVAFNLSGPEVAGVLAGGVPLDLSLGAFPAGTATRTVCGKAEVVLWRRSEHEWRVEVWRSFAPYLATLLAQSAADL